MPYPSATGASAAAAGALAYEADGDG